MPIRLRYLLSIALLCGAHSISVSAFAKTSPLLEGPWRGWLESAGGPIPFHLEIELRPPTVRILNGSEVVRVSRVIRDGDTLELALDDYDAVVRARISEDGEQLKGMWRRRLGSDRWARLAFKAVAGQAPRFLPDAESSAIVGDLPTGRWAARMADLPEASVMLLEPGPEGTVRGTILNHTGDYRYLEGRVDGSRLRLSRFDGAHAFLLDAELDADGNLRGTFVEGNYRATEFTARHDPNAPLPPTFESFSFSGPIPLREESFLDLELQPSSLISVTGPFEALVIEIFGTWCPNCHDASAFLDELFEEYGKRGLRVVGLAFEMTDDPVRNARFVRRYRDKYNLNYPLLLAFGETAMPPPEVFATIHGVFGYPTIIFVRPDGSIHSAHTGFAGPATGAEHERTRDRFLRIVEELLVR